MTPVARAVYEHQRAVLFLFLLTWAMLGTRVIVALLVLLTVVLAVRSVHRRRAAVRARAVRQWERDHPLPTPLEARQTIRKLDPGYAELLDLLAPLTASELRGLAVPRYEQVLK